MPTRAQFHQHSTYSFYARRSRKCKSYWWLNCIFFTLLGSTSIKAVRKTLVKLTPGVNFTKILCTTFTLVYPKSIKKIDNLTVFFMLLGSARVKAVCRMLMKLTPSGPRTWRSNIQCVWQAVKLKNSLKTNNTKRHFKLKKTF